MCECYEEEKSNGGEAGFVARVVLLIKGVRWFLACSSGRRRHCDRGLLTRLQSSSAAAVKFWVFNRAVYTTFSALAG